MSAGSYNDMHPKLGYHPKMTFNVPPPGFVNSVPNKWMVSDNPNTPPMVNNSNHPGFAHRLLPPGPPSHQVYPGPETAHPMNQLQVQRTSPPIQISTTGFQTPRRNVHMGPPPPYYPSSQLDSQPGHPIYAGHQIPHSQQWSIHPQNLPLPFPPQYPKIPVSPAGNFSPPPSNQAPPSNLLPPPYTPQPFLLSPQFYQPPIFPTTMQYQQHSFIPYPAPPQINPTLNHCNVQFNTPSAAPSPNVTACEFDGTVYYSYNGQIPQMTPLPLIQCQSAEIRHFNKLNNEEMASKIHNGIKKMVGVDADKDVGAVSNLHSNRRSKLRRHWKKRNH